MNLMCYLPTGYPSLEKSMEIAELYLKGGCDGIEMSLPYPDPIYEPVHIGAAMLFSLWKNGDYAAYLDAICDFKRRHPECMTVNLVCGQTIRDIGVERYMDFFHQSGMKCLLGVGMDEEMKQAAVEHDTGLSAAVHFSLPEEEIQYALSLKKGIVYMMSKPGPDEELREGCGTVADCISYLRRRGIELPIYCGVGIRTPEDVERIRDAGADGVFLGSSFMNHYDDPEMLLKTIDRLHRAAHN